MGEFPNDGVSRFDFPPPRHRQASGNSRRSSMDSLPEEEDMAVQKPSQLPPSSSEFEVISASKYWDMQEDLTIPTRGQFRIYSAGSGPVVLCLHGGGYTGLTWSLIASLLKQSCRVIAPDLRGHGATHTRNDADLSIDTLAEDVVALWNKLAGPKPPPLVLVGHSMGGAVAVRAAANKGLLQLEGVVVIDVVEGSALAALPAMRNILHNRPTSFTSPEAAIKWAVKSGMSRNPEAASVSVPSMIVQQTSRGPQEQTPTAMLDCIAEDGTPDGGGGTTPASSVDNVMSSRDVPNSSTSSGDGGVGSNWYWRTPLLLSEPHWRGWYEGLSAAFLALPVPKVLVLAGTDRLDRSLTIGQMQGKFQLVLLPKAGHAVQEDEPQRTADAITHFMHRFRVGQGPPVIPTKKTSAPAPTTSSAGQANPA